MRVRDILSKKGDDVIGLLPETRITGAARLLSHDDIGVAVVSGPETGILGIISERDICRGLAEHGAEVLELCVEDLMTREIVTCNIETPMAEAMAIMKARKIRHLPVTDREDNLAGLISMRDIMDMQIGEFGEVVS